MNHIEKEALRTLAIELGWRSIKGRAKVWLMIQFPVLMKHFLSYAQYKRWNDIRADLKVKWICYNYKVERGIIRSTSTFEAMAEVFIAAANTINDLGAVWRGYKNLQGAMKEKTIKDVKGE